MWQQTYTVMISDDSDFNLSLLAACCEHARVSLFMRLKPQTGPGRGPHDLFLLMTSLAPGVVDMSAASAHVLCRGSFWAGGLLLSSAGGGAGGGTKSLCGGGGGTHVLMGKLGTSFLEEEGPLARGVFFSSSCNKGNSCFINHDTDLAAVPNVFPISLQRLGSFSKHICRSCSQLPLLSHTVSS